MAVFTVTQCRTAATCPRLFWFGLQGGQTFFWDERAAFEDSIEHLGRRGREVGIHVVVAVHRPDPRVVSPSLRSTFASRVTFRVGNEAASRLLGA